MKTVEPTKTIDPVKKYDTVVSSGQSALKALLTLNGGATIAFLTFLGQLWQKSPTLIPKYGSVLFDALLLFVWSTFLGVLAYGLIFLTNCLSSKDWENWTSAFFGFTVLVGFASVTCFLAASLRAVEGFRSVTTLSP